MQIETSPQTPARAAVPNLDNNYYTVNRFLRKNRRICEKKELFFL